MKGKKIYFLTFGDIPYDQRMQRIWASLYHAGYEIQIFGRNLTNISLILPYEIKRYSPLFRTGFLSYLEFNTRALIYLLSKRVEVLCCIDLDTMAAGTFAKKIKRFKLVYDAHEYYTESPEIVSRNIIKKFWELIADMCIPSADLNYTVSNSIASEMSLRYKVNFGLIRNLPIGKHIYNDIFISPLDKNYFLYQGALNLGRGLEHLILAMKNISKKELWIAGEGNLTEILQEIVFNNGLQHKVKFLGNLDPVELKFVTKNAYAGINILENLGRSYYLSLANKFFDYIQSGIPQICIDFPEYRILNDEYNVALLVPDTNVNTIEAALNKLINDEIHYSELADNTSRAAGELVWENEAERLIAMYNEL